MDDSIQTLKAEMSKLMSVYDNVKLKPDQATSATPPHNSAGQISPVESNQIITDAGREVLEVKQV